MQVRESLAVVTYTAVYTEARRVYPLACALIHQIPGESEKVADSVVSEPAAFATLKSEPR